MKVVQAIWEKKNLGVNCNEITIETSDDIEKVSYELQKNEAEYTVVKIPTGKTELIFQLQKLNFQYIETITSCYHTGEVFNFNSIQQRLIKEVQYNEMNDNNIEFMYAEIKTGMFRTDRVSLDPYFTIEQSNMRYVNWIKDELEKGCRIYNLMYKEKKIGFFTLKKHSVDEYSAFLSGIYPVFSSLGFGFCAHYYEVIEAKRLGAKRIKTTYSSNNRGATAIHLNMGHVLQEQNYVFIKHHTQ